VADRRQSDSRLLETTVERRVIHEGKYLTFRVDTIEDADGEPHTRELVIHPGAVAVLPLDGEDLLLVRQYRTPAGAVMLEIPAGTLDRDEKGDTEAPDLAAPRELAEETGMQAARWRELGSFWTAPGFTTERLTLYLATELSPVPGYAGPPEGERIDVLRVPWREALRLAEAGELQDAKTLVGVFWLARLAETGQL
jgi:ADP-ribose diphosphatase